MKIASAKKLWDEAMAQGELGWLGPPEEITDEWVFIDNPAKQVNFCFRSPIDQHGEIRDIDDFKQAGINRFCRIDTPIHFPP